MQLDCLGLNFLMLLSAELCYDLDHTVVHAFSPSLKQKQILVLIVSCVVQGRLIALFTSDAQVIAQATAVLPLIAAVMVSHTPKNA